MKRRAKQEAAVLKVYGLYVDDELRCGFHAKDAADADSKMRGWARHHGFNVERERISTELADVEESWMHDEWMLW